MATIGPYRQWRWWHKLSDPLFLVVIAHWLSFMSPLALALARPAGIWLASLSALGVAGAGYKLLLYPLLSPHARYRLASVTCNGASIHLRMLPASRCRIDFQPGQFAFVAFEHHGLREPHPFTIANAGQADGSIAFVVRALGDYTRQLAAEAGPGLLAQVYAPFGRFQRPGKGRAEIWIAGGVGITPFLAWLQDRGAASLEHVSLFHFYTPGRELPPSIDLPALARARGVELVAISDGTGNPAFRERFVQWGRDAGAGGVQVCFCGPAGLLDQVRRLMRELGVPADRLQHELFEFR